MRRYSHRDRADINCDRPDTNRDRADIHCGNEMVCINLVTVVVNKCAPKSERIIYVERTMISLKGELFMLCVLK